MKRTSFVYEEGNAITSVGQFLSELNQFVGRGDDRVYFRGHGSPVHVLVPSIGREHHYLGRAICFDSTIERRLLTQFRRHAYEHFGRLPNEWETVFLARHHGLPTRLLDWTTNPLVALYFAAFYESEDLVASKGAVGRPKLDLDGTLWGIQRRRGVQELDVFTDRRSPLRIPGIRLIYPFNPTPRMRAQSGIFTLHGDPWIDTVVAGPRYSAKDIDISRLIRWNVPSRHKTEIILELERLAINSRTLFPDLEGLAKGLWQTEIMRQCFRNEETVSDPARDQ
jgi:FRG domain